MMSIVLKSLLVLLLCCYTARATCPGFDQIHCKNSDSCTQISYICDRDNDCGDNSDEASHLCSAWRNTDCERNNAKCTRNGRSDCVTISQYCGLNDPPCEGSVDRRLCKMLSDEKIQDIDTIVLETTTFTPETRATCPEPDKIQCKTNDRCTRIRYICDGDNDCGDNSDEDSRLCSAWTNSACARNNATCTRNGRSDCVSISHYCGLNDPPCTGSVDRRLCKMLSDEKIQDIDTITPETRATCSEPGQIHCKIRDKCTRIAYICDGDDDCGDNSDEDSRLCRAWSNSDCGRNNAKCTRNGRSACVTISHYCGVNDPPCEGSVDRRLCKMLSDEKIQDIDTIVLETTTFTPETPVSTVPSVHYDAVDLTNEFKQRLDSTIKHKDCPQLYTKVGDQCVSVFFIGNMPWMESRAFCQSIGGDLFTVKPDLSNFLTLLQHLNANQMTKDFWIGGMYKNESLGWQWVDETDIKVGSPIWAVRHAASCSTREVTSLISNVTQEANDGHCYHYEQAPSTIPNGHCSAITYEHFYYVSDEDCLTKKSPLCILPDEHPQQAL